MRVSLLLSTDARECEYCLTAARRCKRGKTSGSELGTSIDSALGAPEGPELPLRKPREWIVAGQSTMQSTTLIWIMPAGVRKLSFCRRPTRAPLLGVLHHIPCIMFLSAPGVGVSLREVQLPLQTFLPAAWASSPACAPVLGHGGTSADDLHLHFRNSLSRTGCIVFCEKIQYIDIYW